MNEEIKNKAEELSEEEVSDVSGGVTFTITRCAYCERCKVNYFYTVKEVGVVEPHKCPPNIYSERNQH